MRQEDGASVQVQGELSAYRVIKVNPWGQKIIFKNFRYCTLLFLRNEDFYIEVKKNKEKFTSPEND